MKIFKDVLKFFHAVFWGVIFVNVAAIFVLPIPMHWFLYILILVAVYMVVVFLADAIWDWVDRDDK